MSEKVGYVIPEWPGQTHVWVWREVSHLREWGLDVQLISTRKPQQHLRGKHAFSADAEAQTIYLWPMGKSKLVGSVLGNILRAPIGFIRCVALALTLPTKNKSRIGRWKDNLPLLLPACGLASHIRKLGITKLHTDFPAKSAILCMMAKRLTGVPFSLTVVAQFSGWGGAMPEKFAEADFILLTTQWMLRGMRKEFPQVPEEKIRLSPHGVDSRKWTPGDSTLERSADAPTRLLTIARLHRAKGHDITLKAVAKLVEAGMALELRIIGEGEERVALQALATELRIADRVKFLGSQSEEQCMAEMRNTDIFVLASHEEPLGVVYMEAMSTGVATIGTAAGGAPEVITSEADGLLVPPGSVEAVAGAIRRLVENPDLRKQLATAGRESVIRKLDSRVGAAILYEKLTGVSAVGKA